MKRKLYGTEHFYRLGLRTNLEKTIKAFFNKIGIS